jgi:hypothetical protein
LKHEQIPGRHPLVLKAETRSAQPMVKSVEPGTVDNLLRPGDDCVAA